MATSSSNNEELSLKENFNKQIETTQTENQVELDDSSSIQTELNKLKYEQENKNKQNNTANNNKMIQNHRRIFKIIVIGDSNVGKTCLTYRFCGGKFLDRSEATIGVDFREKTIQIDDETIKLQIWDTGNKTKLI